MKISKQTLAFIKNLATINTNLLIKPGNVLATISSDRTVVAEMEIAETMPVQFGIYDLNEFLGVISIFNDPDVNLSEKEMTIIEGKNRIRYLPADSEIIVSPKSKVKFPGDAEVNFKLAASELTQIIKASSVLKSPNVSISGNGSEISIKVHDKTNPNSNQFTITKGETEHTFDFHVRVDLLKMLVEDYDVSISSKKMCQFSGDSKTYWVMCETDSSFGG